MFNHGWRDLRRTDAGARLFPAAFRAETGDGAWIVSVQADQAGYGCHPRTRLDRLGDYREVEVMVRSPWHGVPDLAAMGVPAEIVDRMDGLGPHSAMMARMSPDEVDGLITAISRAVMSSPNAGCPRGVHNWPGRQVFHGTDHDSAEDIICNGVSMDLCTPGYMGQAFYMAEDIRLAQAAYADAHDEKGAVVSGILRDDARILDLRNPADSEFWKLLANSTHLPNFASIARRAGVDGVFDRSVGDLAIYNAAVVEDLEIVAMPWPEPEDGMEDPGA